MRSRCPPLAFGHGKGTELDIRTLRLIATVIEHCEGSSEPVPGHPPAATVRVLAALRRFLREGTPWRSLRATSAQVSGSTLRRRLAAWTAVNLLQRVHALLVAMLRGDPDLILDSRSVRAKRGGELTGPNPTDRGKRGTKYHIATTGDGLPGPSPACTSAADHAGRGWASAAGRSSAATPGSSRTSASPCVTTGSASSCNRCSRPRVSSWLRDASSANCENCL